MDGDIPFEGTWEELKERHLTFSPPNLKNIESYYIKIIGKTIAKNPNNRFQKVEEIISLLSKSKKQETTHKTIVNNDRHNSSNYVRQSILWFEVLIQKIEKQNNSEISANEKELKILRSKMSNS